MTDPTKGSIGTMPPDESGPLDDGLDGVDYYALLGVPRDARAAEVRDAFHAFALLHHPDRHVGSDPATRERSERLFRRGAEAYRVLLDPELRRRYDEGLVRGRLRLDPEADAESARRASVPAGTLPVRTARARPFAQRASEAIRAGDVKTARLHLRLALQHDPGNPDLERALERLERGELEG
ncbi:MAG: J domain-containing protein [Myxococcota bacterium]|nr:J domain-containing protein [Myxococcota bacterium]MDW8362033.1 J domain-containing protein [Myxococcales bacterium]